MAFLRPKTLLSAGERVERRRLILSDTLSIATLFVITVLLAVITNAFYQSYASHQTELSKRWLARGESSLQQGKPQPAVNALHSALALAPGQRNIEMELAEALAAAGRVQEATSYFTTLAESEPGDGMIQLQLARLAVRQGNTAQALESYHRAIYGNWEGDGATRRREARLEMVGYLISQGRYNQARNELLVAAGNTPEGDSAVLLNIAQSLEKATAPADALGIYKSVLEHRPTLFEAIEGAGRTAFQAGHYAEASRYLTRALNAPEVASLPGQDAGQMREMLDQSERLLLLYPSPQLSLHDRGIRILADRKIAQARLASCVASKAPAASSPAPASSPSATQPAQGQPAESPAAQAAPPQGPNPQSHSRLQSLARHFEHHPAPASAGPQAPSPTSELQSVEARWSQLPQKVTLSGFENNPELASTQIQLIYDTERVTAQACGPPAGGDDILLLKIAQAPNAVDQE